MPISASSAVRALAVAGLLLAAPAPGRAADPAASPPAAAGSWGWAGALLEPLDALSRWVDGLFIREERFVADEIGRFKHVVDTDLSTFDSLVKQAGFRLSEIRIGAGLVPRIALAMEFERRPSESEKAALLARVTDASGLVGTIERSVIMTLLNAADSAYAVRADGYRLSGVDIDVDVVPNVTFVMSAPARGAPR